MTVFCVPDGYGADVTLAWDRNTEPGVLGYRVYYGTRSQSYPTRAYEGTNTTATISGLTPGQTYYFTATAYNSSGESGFAPEIEHTIPIVVQTYTISASAGNGGSISPAGSVSVNQGASRSFAITPNSGYRVAGVTVDGSNVGAVNSYSFTNVAANHSISASFAAQTSTYTISASAGNGGRISPAGSVSVNQGASRSFTITPNSGYRVAGVTVDGSNVGAVNSYSFTNVAANHSISASFAAQLVNQAPAQPELLYPADNATDVPTEPLLEISGYSDPDAEDDHGATQWQIAKDSSFRNLVLDVTSDESSPNHYLVNLLVPQGTLSGKRQYYWRARVRDARNSDSKWSAWSDAFRFNSATPAKADNNANGVPDEIEPSMSDMDGDGQNDNDQPLMRVFSIENGSAQVGIKAIDGVSQINAYTYVDPINITDANGPRKLRYGLMNLNLQLINVGGTARLEIYLPEAVDRRARWYKHDSVNGWYEYPVDIVNDTYVLEITDGGFGDADGVANGVIVDPIGLSGDSLTVDAGSVPSSVSGSGGGGGGGCFIQSAGSGSTTVGLLAALLVLGAACGTGVVMRYRQAVVPSKTRF